MHLFKQMFVQMDYKSSSFLTKPNILWFSIWLFIGPTGKRSAHWWQSCTILHFSRNGGSCFLTCDWCLHLHHALLLSQDVGAVVYDAQGYFLLHTTLFNQMVFQDFSTGLAIHKQVLYCQPLVGGQWHCCRYEKSKASVVDAFLALNQEGLARHVQIWFP